jgi:hypothetical protein
VRGRLDDRPLHPGRISAGARALPAAGPRRRRAARPAARAALRDIGGDGDGELRGDDLLDGLAWIHTAVYGIAEARRGALYDQVERGVRDWPGGVAPAR